MHHHSSWVRKWSSLLLPRTTSMWQKTLHKHDLGPALRKLICLKKWRCQARMHTEAKRLALSFSLYWPEGHQLCQKPKWLSAQFTYLLPKVPTAEIGHQPHSHFPYIQAWGTALCNCNLHGTRKAAETLCCWLHVLHPPCWPSFSFLVCCNTYLCSKFSSDFFSISWLRYQYCKLTWQIKGTAFCETLLACKVWEL